MVSVIYKKRALSIAWIVVKGNKAISQRRPVQLLGQVHQIMLEGVDVICVGDGEFDGIALQATINGYAWQYACPTAKNTQLRAEMELVAEACYWYAKRFRIETFFSDQKSRGSTCTKATSRTRRAWPAW